MIANFILKVWEGGTSQKNMDISMCLNMEAENVESFTLGIL